MRILVDSGEHALADKGRLARIDVALSRLRELWPGAEIGLLTDHMTQANLFFPGVTPVPYTGGAWPDSAYAGRLKMSGPEFGLNGAPVDRGPQILGGLRGSESPHDAAPPGVRAADLLVSAGRENLSDLNPDEVLQTLLVLEAALSAGRTAAMFGQSFGPIEHPELKLHASRVLPRLEQITVNEGISSPRALDLLGVPAEKISITGDDAFELAVANTTDAGGVDLGVNVRMSEYSRLDAHGSEVLGDSIRDAAHTSAAHLSPVYVSEHNDEDRLGTLKLIGDYPLVRPDYSRYAHPREVVERIGRCRVLVTTSRAGAVFALAQGVPTVCLTPSDYDLAGFDGLSALFPMGCRVVPLSAPRLGDTLEREINTLWAAAPALKPSLISIASDHIAEGQAANIRLFKSINSREAALTL